jgi:hypothetical protein
MLSLTHYVSRWLAPLLLYGVVSIVFLFIYRFMLILGAVSSAYEAY